MYPPPGIFLLLLIMTLALADVIPNEKGVLSRDPQTGANAVEDIIHFLRGRPINSCVDYKTCNKEKGKCQSKSVPCCSGNTMKGKCKGTNCVCCIVKETQLNSKNKECSKVLGKCQKRSETCNGNEIPKICIDKRCVCCTAKCVWFMKKEFKINPPLLLDENNDIIVPEGEERMVSIDFNQEITIACPGDTNILEELVNPKRSAIKVKCASKNRIQDSNTNKIYDMKDMACQNRIHDTVEKDGDCNKKKGIKLGIGFGYEYSKNYPFFKEIIEVCFDNDLQTTYWTEHKIHGTSLKSRIKDQETRSPITDNIVFQEVSISNVYPRQKQRDLFEELKIGKEYINAHRRYLQKGHLSPVADFATLPEMQATNYYINVLPQWAPINNGNWKIVEEEVRTLAKKKPYDLIIRSGGLAQLAVDGIDIFLGKVNKKYTKVPVPYYFWKFVSTGSKAVVFVVFNNPYLEKEPKAEELMCNDICEELLWLNDPERIDNFDYYMRHNVCYGYTYCCEVNDDLRKHIPYLPGTGTMQKLLN